MNVQLDIPRIETDRLILRGFQERDFDFIAQIYGDEDTARFIGGQMPPYQAWRTLAVVIGHWVLRGFGLFCVEEKTTGDVVGFCGPWRPMGFPDNEIGYGFLKTAQGKGYAVEAAIAALKFSYNTLGWKTAISQINPLNEPSQKVARKLGAFNEQQDVMVNEKKIDIWRHLSPEQFMAKHNLENSA